ncbi:tetratricopeptide repeat protein [Methylobacterium sp. C25]|uniref:winged helix-turn-helix domain-containing tetratricopeptide repeat protein n=1 Tax=Methylobacterium sp. C25 TaxID=2721622 RepID=UPI001F27215C|nr:winged helix-turn-helix domain-containing protein [Methylobacterium sp. C25]MCE4222571.1 tetratricopeptide repeat protein [Methylobacterium sp. C25]
MVDCITLSEMVVDLRREQILTHAGRRLELRPRSFDVLRRLASSAGDLVTKDDLLADCWPGVIVTEDSLTQCISDIRKTLGPDGRDLIRTIPKRGYMLVLPGASEPAPVAAAAIRAPGSFWPSIAILPFDEFTAAPNTYGVLGAGFAEDITTELARNRNVTVIARHSSFAAKALGGTASDIARVLAVRYILEGSIRRSGDRMIVNAQLVDGISDSHVWAERYAFAAQDLFVVQDELTARIAATLFSGVQSHEQGASLRRPPASLDVYELTVRSAAKMLQFSQASVASALEDVETAIVLDPLYGAAHVARGFCIATDAAMAITGEASLDRLDHALSAIRRGLELDPMLPTGHRALGYALLYTGRYEEALIAAERSVALSPGEAMALAFLSLTQTGVGHYADALASVERAISLSPLAPGFYQGIAAGPLYALDRFEETLRNATGALIRSPGYLIAYAMAAASCVRLDRTEEAVGWIADLLRRSPTFSLKIPRVAHAFGRDRRIADRFAEDLRASGLPM